MGICGGGIVDMRMLLVVWFEAVVVVFVFVV